MMSFDNSFPRRSLLQTSFDDVVKVLRVAEDDVAALVEEKALGCDISA